MEGTPRRSRRRRGPVAFVAAVLAVASLLGVPVARLAAPPQALAAGTFADPFFRETAVIATGLTNPTAVRFAADGRVFVAEKAGRVKEFDSLSDTTATTVIDLRPEVNSYWDRGLLGMALDPQFTTGRPYLYLFYAYDAPPGQTAPVWNDVCPNPPGGMTDGCVVTLKLVRFTVGAGSVASPASRLELIAGDTWCDQFPSHAAGTLLFGPDGALYASAGDGAGFGNPDYGQYGGTLSGTPTPANPCGDPPNPAGTADSDPATAEGGSLRSQDVRTTADPTGLDGAIIRINPDTGLGFAGNPMIGSPDLNNRRIVAYGFRNPFRVTFRPGTSEIYAGDVGQDTWEEVDRVPISTALTGALNHGWPCYEGNGPTPVWQGLGINLCTSLYGAAGSTRSPLYAYSHDQALSPTGPCFNPTNGRQSSSISGLAFYTGASGASVPYPSRYDGALFFADYSRSCIAVLLANPNGIPDASTMETFETSASHPVDLQAGPGGDLFYADLDGNRIMRIHYRVAPVARATATPSSGSAPLQVTLDASTSSDPDPQAEIGAWDWDLDDDGTFETPGKTIQHTFPDARMYPVTLRVTSTNGLTDTATIIVDASNDPPVPHVASPSASLTWAVGDHVSFSGSATDAQDGALPASALTWNLWMLHCPADCHEHLVQTWDGVASGSFDAPDHEYPSHLELRLTATDSHGAPATATVALQPKTANLTVRSNPTGIPVLIADASHLTPDTETFILGGAASVGAPAMAVVGGSSYRFSAWSDGGARAHTLTMTGDRTLTATYVREAPNTCAGATVSSPTGKWLTDDLAPAGDEDWFRFSLTSAKRVVITLGDLPVDARLDLYGSCSTHLASSEHGGTRYEEITKLLAAGTYRVRVSSAAAGDSASPYVVQLRPLASGIALKSSRLTRSGSSVKIVGEIVNNSGSTRQSIVAVAEFRDSAGNRVARLTGSAFTIRLANGSATSFLIRGTVASYARVVITFTSSSPTSTALPRLSLTSLTSTPGAGGTATESGTVKNIETTTAHGVTVCRTWYGRRGEILDRVTDVASPSTLAGGTSGAFSLLRPALPTMQAARTQLRAT